jgi:serralysin
MAGFITIKGSGWGNPLMDSLIWGGQIWDMSTGPIKVKFGTSSSLHEWRDEIWPATPHENATPFDSDPTPTDPDGFQLIRDTLHDWKWRSNWYSDEVNSMAYAAGLYEHVANIEFADADGYEDANMVWWKVKLTAGVVGAHESPDRFQDSAHQRWGYFDHFNTNSWTERQPGGDGLNTIIHELGHALGLAHPHDGGAREDRTTFPGADSASNPGTLGQNQSVFSVMSYVPGHSSAKGDLTYGTQYGLGALDIAALQLMYGANTTAANGNDVYELPTQNARGTGWFSIWDTGGTDTISAAKSTTSVTIDLRAATLAPNDPNAGGFLSQQAGIAGGVTIANKVVIENAIGGSGNDTLVGNAAANNLNGGLGNDTYHIDANDVIVDAGGVDTVYANFNYSNPNIENVYVNGVLTQSGGATVTNGFAVFKGTSGKNTLTGTDGNDKMYGLGGNDILIGSKGTDIFVFNTKLNAKTNKDTVKAFATKEDKVWLDNAIFKKLGKGTESKPEKLKKSFFKIGSQAGDANDYIIIDKKKGVISYDVDGNGSQKSVAFAVFDKKALPNLADFFVV